MQSLLLFVLAAVLAEPSGAPTMDQLNELMTQKKYQDVLRGVSRCLSLRGPASQPYNRYDLLTLRGNAYLRSRAGAQAVEAFAAAGKATDDADQKAVAHATELLIKKSKPTGYVSRATTQSAGRAAVLPILEPVDRKAAFAAMLDDELAASSPTIKAATEDTALPPVIDGARALFDLRAIEIAASGSTTRTKEIGQRLGQHAHKLIDEALKGMDSRIELIWKSGSRTRYRTDRNGVIQEKLYGMMGLTSVDTDELKSTMGECEKIIPVAGDLATVTGGDALSTDAGEARRLLKRAREVMEYDYNNEGRYNKNPPAPENRTNTR